MKPVALTPGELLLLQQMRMVARFQGWDFKKLVKKVGKLNSLLQGTLAQEQAPAQEPARTDPAVTQAEALLKEIQDMMKSDPPPEPPPV